MKESKSMMKKEVSFMKKKGAPKSMIKHEEAEMEGKKMRKFAAGGQSLSERTKAREEAYRKATSVESRAAAARAARGLAPRNPNKPVYTMDDYRKQYPSKGKALPPILPPSEERLTPMPPPKLPGFDLPSPGRGAPITPPPGGLPDNTQAMMRKGGAVKKYARGGGIESKGKTRGHIVKMASGGHVGSASKRADGIASKGKTRGKMC